MLRSDIFSIYAEHHAPFPFHCIEDALHYDIKASTVCNTHQTQNSCCIDSCGRTSFFLQPVWNCMGSRGSRRTIYKFPGPGWPRMNEKHSGNKKSSANSLTPRSMGHDNHHTKAAVCMTVVFWKLVQSCQHLLFGNRSSVLRRNSLSVNERQRNTTNTISPNSQHTQNQMRATILETRSDPTLR